MAMIDPGLELFGKGDIYQVLLTAPAVCFTSLKTKDMIKKCPSLTYPAPLRANMNFDCLSIATASRELWVLEWVSKKDRLCRIKYSNDNSVYWICKTNPKAKSDNVFATNFKEVNGKMSTTFDGVVRPPSLFSVNIVGNLVALQDAESKLWLTITKKGEIELRQSFSDETQLSIGMKVGIFIKPMSLITHAPYRRFLSAAGGFRDRKLVFELLWAEKRACFMLIPQQSHFLIYTARGYYCSIDNKNMIVNSTEKASEATHFKLQMISAEEFHLCAKDEQHPEFTPVYHHKNNLFVKSPQNPVPSEGGTELFLVYLPEKCVDTPTPETPIPKKPEPEPVISNPELRVFGESLRVLVERDKTDVPIFVQHCIQYLRKQHDSQGMFRLSGSHAVVIEATNKINNGIRLNQLLKENPRIGVDEVASLLKTFIKLCPELLPKDFIHTLTSVANQEEDTNSPMLQITCGEDTLEYRESQRQEYRRIMQEEAPKTIRDVFGYLCKFFHDLATHSEINKMTVSNLSIVIVPNLHKAHFLTTGLHQIFQVLVIDYYSIFQ